VNVPATLDAQPLGDSKNTETLFIVRHGSRLFASTGQWTVPDSQQTGGQVLVKSRASESWAEILRTPLLRVSALSSFSVPAKYSGSNSKLVLLTFTQDGNSIAAPLQLKWLFDDETQFSNTFGLPTGPTASIRAFAAHDDGTSFAFFAAVRGYGIVRGQWNNGNIAWNAVPEFTLTTRSKAMASCGGALYASMEDALYRRNDDPLAPGQSRWTSVYVSAEAEGSGIRGLTCVSDPVSGLSLLASVEGPGLILRFDNLPADNLPNGSSMQPVVEAYVRDVIRDGLGRLGTTVPASGRGSVGYIIPAYNDFLLLNGPDNRVVYGLEWAYAGSNSCPTSRVCSEQSDFDAAACFVVRTGGAMPTHSLRCLSGTALTPRPNGQLPTTAGEAFVATRTIAPSPWSADQFYFGGYDANGIDSVGTAWVATAPIQ